MPYPFLSDEWLEEARKIRAEYAGKSPAIPHVVRMNLVVTGAETEFQRAIRLDPRYATARHWYATSCLVPMARLDDALEQMQIAQTLDPVSSIIARVPSK